MRCALCLPLLVFAVFLPACGSSTGRISGSVKYKGQPLAGATITFYDEKNVTPSAVIASDGSYSLDAPVGKAKIAVVTPLVLDISNMPEQKVIVIPDKYRDRESSGLVCDVKGGAQIHNIDLTD